MVGPKYHPPAPQAPAAVYKESPTQFTGNWRLDGGAARGCQAARQVVGDLQRSRTERPRRTTGYQQPEHQTVLRELHGSPRDRARGPLAIFSDAHGRAFVHPLANLGEPEARPPSIRQARAPLPNNCKARSTRCRSKLPGSPIFGARSATRCAKPSTLPRSARPISRTSA